MCICVHISIILYYSRFTIHTKYVYRNKEIIEKGMYPVDYRLAGYLTVELAKQ